MNLCIDWGNSRVKAALFQEENLLETHNFREDEALTSIMDLVEAHKPEAAIISSVANHPPELKALLQERAKVIVLNSDIMLPIINAYHSPGTLGADRIALAVAAHHFNPAVNNLVISIGTAITYNFVHKNKTFRGGAITPGIEMRFRALNEYTDKLPLVTAKGELLLLGYDTETNIRSGVLNGIAAEMDGMINNFREQFQDINVYLTGGDSSFFADKLKNQIFADSQLLLKGLNLILRYNVR